MSRRDVPFLLGVVLVLLGVLGGVLYDRAPPARAPVVRAGHRVLAADFHVHTTLSDGGLSPFAVPWHARKRGLDVIAVTEHNGVLAARLAKLAARAMGDASKVLVISGEEITTREAHMIAVGVTRGIAPSSNPADAVRAVHEQGGVVFAAHPVARFWPALVPVRSGLDGSEVAHPFANPSARVTPGWRASDLRAFFDDAAASGKPLAAIGSSDYHWGTGLGRVRTWVFVPEATAPSEQAVLDAVRARRTVVRTPSGELLGDPAFVDALTRDPQPELAVEKGYAGAGAPDRVLRALGLLGVLVIVVFRRAPRSRRPVPRKMAVLASWVRPLIQKRWPDAQRSRRRAVTG
ncbi:MAG TPA: CehA/McbA family metallohydrolase [Labilithrix sp.]|nr:CehA/McbA family metallohydrolase [Labilithrix sp.]